MPKHNIYPTRWRFPGEALPAPHDQLPEGPAGRLELHWQRGGSVQLGTTRWVGDPSHVDTAVEYLEPAGEDPLRRAWEGWFLDLDRDGINHLIKQLRAARDQTYGKDE